MGSLSFIIVGFIIHFSPFYGPLLCLNDCKDDDLCIHLNGSYIEPYLWRSLYSIIESRITFQTWVDYALRAG